MTSLVALIKIDDFILKIIAGILMKLSKKEISKLEKEIKHMSKEQKKKLKEGAKVEGEHTKNKSVRNKIAEDHLKEDKNYYKKLKKVENKKKGKQK